MRSHRSICFFSGVLLLRASAPQEGPRKMFRNFTFPEHVQKLLGSCPKTFWKFLLTFPGHSLDNVRGKNALKSKTRSFCIHIFISFKSSRLFIHYCCKFVSKCDIRCSVRLAQFSATANRRTWPDTPITNPSLVVVQRPEQVSPLGCMRREEVCIRYTRSDHDVFTSCFYKKS